MLNRLRLRRTGGTGARIQTDGMDASKPIADNKTLEGKAQNRRVDFVKM